MEYYVYKHTFRNGVVYFGKGSGKRIFSNKRNKFWLNLFTKYGEPVREYLHINISEEIAYILEEMYIISSRNTKIKSCNISSGGEASASGNIQSEDTRKKISLKLKGIRKSEITKQRMKDSWTTLGRKPKINKEVIKRKEYKNSKISEEHTCNRKAIQQFNKQNEYITEYTSIQEASRVTGINHGNISSVCNHKLKSAGGFHWNYKIN